MESKQKKRRKKHIKKNMTRSKRRKLSTIVLVEVSFFTSLSEISNASEKIRMHQFATFISMNTQKMMLNQVKTQQRSEVNRERFPRT